jgi:hypothetical protein
MPCAPCAVANKQVHKEAEQSSSGCHHGIVMIAPPVLLVVYVSGLFRQVCVQQSSTLHHSTPWKHVPGLAAACTACYGGSVLSGSIHHGVRASLCRQLVYV